MAESEIDVSMRTSGSWKNALGKGNRGSRPRCIELVSGTKEEVASNLSALVGLEEVMITPDDFWMPRGKPFWSGKKWDTSPADEARIDIAEGFVSCAIRAEVRNWWLAVPHGNTPNWDLASTCTIEGRKGLLLVEAKAHSNELSNSGKSPPSSANSRRNHEKIGSAILEASADLERLTGRTWRLSRDDRYQLSNRFAWSWKLTSLEIPVVLVYLGFLNALEMAQDGTLFRTEIDWSKAILSHASGMVDKAIWGERITINRSPFLSLVRAAEVEF